MSFATDWIMVGVGLWTIMFAITLPIIGKRFLKLGEVNKSSKGEGGNRR